MRKYWKQAIVYTLTCLVFCIFAGVNIHALSVQYPELEVEQEGNLKDFEVEGDGLRSTTMDPWVECHLDNEVNIYEVLIEIDGYTESSHTGQIYDMDDWSSVYYYFKNGKNYISLEDPQKEHLNIRFDVIETENTYIEIKKIVINPFSGWIRLMIRQYLLCLIALLVIEKLLFGIGKSSNKVGRLMFCFCLAAAIVCHFYILQSEQVSDSNLICMLIGIASLCIVGILENTKHRYWVASAVSALLTTAMIELLSGVDFNFNYVGTFVWNVCIVAAPILLLYILTGSARVAIVVVQVFGSLLGIVNHYYYYFRQEVFEFSDLTMAETAASVIGAYEFPIDAFLVFVFFAEVGMSVYVVSLGKKSRDKKMMLASLVALGGIAMGLVANSNELDYWNIDEKVNNYGYLDTFIKYAKQDLLYPKPEGYSLSSVRDILDKYEEFDSDEEERITAENIIVIMDEAFCDLPTLYGFETNEDGLPFIHSLEDNTIKGWALVSSFGGSTANTEWEFLTGNTMAFSGNASCPYVQYIKRDTGSLASELKLLNYDTVAIHPYDEKNYNRDTVYPLLGFDEFINKENAADSFWNIRLYSSDLSVFQKNISLYEQKTENPLFIFNVTLQNHGGYSSSASSVEVTVEPLDDSLDFVQLEEYLSLVKETDTAFQYLVEYFEEQDEPTVIALFGDHQPGLDQEVYNAMIAASGRTEPYIEYMVPFVIWANYDIEEESDVLTSINYLRTRVLEVAGLSMNDYDNFLLSCMEQYPAINANGFFDTEGNYYNMSDDIEDIEILREYRILEYANLFDKKAADYFR
jgi:phosphoglycerol transferase MdoB-like AlkP superfamily enzyme